MTFKLNSQHLLLLIICFVCSLLILLILNQSASSPVKDYITGESEETILNDNQLVRKYFFVGVPSTCSQIGTARRNAIREHLKQYRSIADVQYFVDRTEYYLASPPRQCDSILRDEVEQYNDIVFTSSLESQQGPQALIYKTDAILSHMISSPYKYRFLMKMDDDSLVLVDRFKEKLEETIDQPFLNKHPWLTTQTALRKSIMAYVGFFLGRSTVLNSNPRFKSDTGLEFYPMYAQGSTYCVSSRLVEAIHKLSQLVELKKWGSEDTTMGFRILSMKHKRVHLTGHYMFEGFENCEPQTMVFHPMKKAEDLTLASNVVYQNMSRACEIFMEATRPKPKPKTKSNN